MMKITEVVVSRTVRVNLGDYQSVDFFVSMKATPDGSNLEAVRAQLSQNVDMAVARDIAANFKRRGKGLSREQIAKRYGLNTGE